jgi:hypothetical protein
VKNEHNLDVEPKNSSIQMWNHDLSILYTNGKPYKLIDKMCPGHQSQLIPLSLL